LPSVNKLYKEFKPKGLEVLLINFGEASELVKRAVEERGYVAPVLLDRSGDVTGRLYGVWGPPTSYFIDRRGRLIGRIVGPRDREGAAARKLVEELLALR